MELLKATGEKHFDLPVHWLPAANGVSDGGDGGETGDSDGGAGAQVGSGDDSDSDNGTGSLGDDGGSDDTDGSSSDSETEAAYLRQRGWPRNDRTVVRVKQGNFAFFLATNAPFLVGKIIAEGVEHEGDDGVDIHWFRPAKDLTPDNVQSMSIEEYGKGGFVEGFVVSADDRTGRTARGRRVRKKDVSWEPVQCIVATSENLIGNGRKIPKGVLRVLRSTAGGVDWDRSRSKRKEQNRGGQEDELHENEGSGASPDGRGCTVGRRLSTEREEEKQNEERGEQGDEVCQNWGGGASSSSQGCTEDPSRVTAAGPVSHVETTQSSTGARKIAHPPSEMPQSKTRRVVLTAAHFRTRHGGGSDEM